ncbi:MAG: hypothetical protein U1E08_07335 [Coriobacteriia bacterium]|nr:hypothetical protein [Actinomycetota bacterium]MDZ4167490.1 hypothetical protein [Coriobacteriia bacterium]
MAAEDQQRRFEPPPWEREAFERFEREREARQAEQQLEAALRAAREPATDVAAESAAEDLPSPAAPAPPVEVTPEPTAETAPVLPESRIDAMLVELRMEEPRPAEANKALIDLVIGFFAVTGLFVIVQAAVLFARVGASDAASTMLAATMSFVVLLAGLGFLAGAFLLFRKYHR